MFFKSKPLEIPAADAALPGRSDEQPTASHHFVNGAALKGPYPDGSEMAVFGLGCFWGAERIFWQVPGVHVTAVGYGAGHTPNPTYKEVCSGQTGHNEVVLVVFDPNQVSYEKLVGIFFEAHNPTQHMRQGNDVGTQYRSGIYTYSDEQVASARALKAAYEAELKTKGFGTVATEIEPAGEFYFADADHQQYLAKNPGGYCGLGGTGVSCPIAAAPAAAE